jgi:heterotetrameric sarcosine oxidase gamma subunit
MLKPRNPLADIALPGRYGRRVGGPRAVVLMERPYFDLCALSARRGRMSEISETVRKLTHLILPEGPKRVAAEGLSLIGMAPGQWLAVAEDAAAAERLRALTLALAGLATSVDQSDGKTVLRIGGPRARETLAKGCGIDLDPRVFAPGDAATTPIALIDCVLWQVDEEPSYDLAVPSTLAESFWSWLTAAAAEYGYEVAPLTPVRTGLHRP